MSLARRASLDSDGHHRRLPRLTRGPFRYKTLNIDVKPKHGSPDFARDAAFEKIKARVDGTKAASAALGLS